MQREKKVFSSRCIQNALLRDRKVRCFFLRGQANQHPPSPGTQPLPDLYSPSDISNKTFVPTFPNGTSPYQQTRNVI
ncbi:hypothetical protein WG66_002386 [Moniliophthora roreri]|nr:hypothetical protein WG66_002386 [Moniliophthora roreri]